METALSIALGLGLAAACGFRIFVPLLVMSAAARSGHLTLTESFEWIGSTPALIAFGSATALEIGAYYVPWLDNVLDALTTPAAVVAGMVATGSQVADLDPWLSWSLAIIGGGGAAGSVQGLTVLTRQVSSFATGGLGNPLVSTAEAGASLVVAVLAILAPLVAVTLLLLGVYFGLRKVISYRARGDGAAATAP
ncbi:MAG: DUF4126 domain-containing protein [Acidobacteria bacterium]|nr:MAG: DUF4126 domain-containing protein [Acidobacteriota bacterium]